MRALVIEDNPRMGGLLSQGLTEEGWTVDLAHDARVARGWLERERYDVLVLDWMLPDQDGLALLRSIRSEGEATPVLMLTARDRLEDRVQGLDAGADDYLVKPFEFEELLARLRALLRRGGPAHAPTLEIGGLEIDTRSHRVRLDGNPIPLTAKEYALLEYLAVNAGRIV